jgi:hypothetical protein
MTGLIEQPHIVACAYEDELAAKRVFAELLNKQCGNSGTMRIHTRAGRQVVLVCADDEAAASYSARLPWGPGVPIILPDDICTAIVARRVEGARLAGESPTGTFVRHGIAETIPVRPEVAETTIHVTALNTASQPWSAVGGICGAVCPSFADAAHVREALVSKHLQTMEGMVVALGDADGAVAVVIADTPQMSAFGTEALLRLAGNVDYEPEAGAAWCLWAMRHRVGSAPFPITFQGNAQETQDFFAGGHVPPRVKVHAPTRNQACPCGSGIKYKRCCGR